MSASAAIDELASDFEILGDWDARYEYITELGNRLGDLPDADKTHATKVHGCMSNVYVVGEIADDPPGTICYRAECDTAIIRGVIAIILMMYKDLTPEQALAVDADELFEKLGLFDHLSPTRHVGIYAIVERIRAVARELGGD